MAPAPTSIDGRDPFDDRDTPVIAGRGGFGDSPAGFLHTADDGAGRARSPLAQMLLDARSARDAAAQGADDPLRDRRTAAAASLAAIDALESTVVRVRRPAPARAAASATAEAPGPGPVSAAAGYIEHTVGFDSNGVALLGILAVPAGGTPEAAACAVVIAAAGPHYRVGAHRQHVHVSRAFASAGHPTLRFDVAGSGDNVASSANLESIGNDIAAALDALQNRLPSARDVALWGVGEAATAALLFAASDPRITRLILQDPAARGPAGVVRAIGPHVHPAQLTHHAARPHAPAAPATANLPPRRRPGGLRQLWDAAWRRLDHRLQPAGHAGADRARPAPSLAHAIADGLALFRGRVLFVVDGDADGRDFSELVRVDRNLRTLMSRMTVERWDLAGMPLGVAFSSPAIRRKAEDRLLAFLGRRQAMPSR